MFNKALMIFSVNACTSAMRLHGSGRITGPRSAQAKAHGNGGTLTSSPVKFLLFCRTILSFRPLRRVRLFR